MPVSTQIQEAVKKNFIIILEYAQQFLILWNRHFLYYTNQTTHTKFIHWSISLKTPNNCIWIAVYFCHRFAFNKHLGQTSFHISADENLSVNGLLISSNSKRWMVMIPFLNSMVKQVADAVMQDLINAITPANSKSTTQP